MTRNILSLLGLWAMWLPLSAQTVSPETATHPYRVNALYVTAGFDLLDDTNRGGLGLNLLFQNQWGLSWCMNAWERTAADLPADYVPGSIFGYPSGSPDDRSVFYALRLTRTIPLARRIRVVLETGPSYGRHITMAFEPRPAEYPNYIGRERKSGTLGLSACSKLEFTITRWVGFEVSAYADANRQHSVLGTEFRLLFGWLRDPIP